jgi:hypothetical protein
MAGLLRGDDPLGNPLDAFGVRNRRSAVLLHDETQRSDLQWQAEASVYRPDR